MRKPRAVGLVLLLILGLLGMHVFSGSALDHGAHPTMLADAPHPQARAQVLTPGPVLAPGRVLTPDCVAAVDRGSPSERASAPHPGAASPAAWAGKTLQAAAARGGAGGAMAACLLALLSGAVLLLLPFRPALALQPRVGLLAVTRHARRLPRPPSLHALSISRT